LAEKIIKNSNLVRSLEYLLKNRTTQNNDTLQYLLDPRRGNKRLINNRDVLSLSLLIVYLEFGSRSYFAGLNQTKHAKLMDNPK
jgi:hypothetical protein